MATDKQLTADSETCPYCSANLIGGEIPEDQRSSFGGKRYFSRVIVVKPEKGTSFFKCPDCGIDQFPDGWGMRMPAGISMTNDEAQQFLKDIADKKRQS